MTDVYVLSGFLGAGKTSLLRHILSSTPDRKTVVLVNEFGSLGLDGRLLEREGLPLYELNSGCICCTLENELGQTLGTILESCQPERILIEASGIANPANISQTVHKLLLQGLRLAKCLTVLDCRMWPRRSLLGSLFLEQIAEADVLVLNKTDLVSEEQAAGIEHAVHKLFPKLTICPTSYGQIAPDLFWARAEQKDLCSRFLLSCFQEEDKVFKNLVYTSDKPLHRDAFNDLLATLPETILRAKGQICFSETGKAYLDYVAGQTVWSEPPQGLHGTCLVFIGAGFEEDWLKRSLDEMQVKSC